MVNFIQIPEERKARVKSASLKVGTFIGGIFLLILLIWGAVSAASFSSKRAKESTSGEKPVQGQEQETSVTSGKPFVLSWSHLSKSTDGFYTMSYPCTDGFFLTAETQVQGKEIVFCNTPFRSITSGNEITLTASSTKLREVKLPLTISFTKNDSDRVKKLGVIEVKVINSAIPILATTTASTTTSHTSSSTAVVPGTGNSNTGGTYAPPAQTPGQTTSRTYTVNVPGSGTYVNNPNGKPDLHPRILQVGYIDSSNNFIPSDTVNRNQRVAVRFIVENLGNKESGTWRFNAILPTYPNYTFNSDSQATMLPGDRVEFTLGFDRIVEGNSTFTVQIDGGNLVIESDESNNNVSINIKAL